MLTLKLKAGDKAVCTQEVIAYALDLTGQRISQLLQVGDLKKAEKDSGVDLLESVRMYVRKMRERDSKADGTGISAADARRMKTLKEVEKLDLQIAQQKGELVAIDEVREKATRAGALLIAELASMANDAPGMLAGADEATIRERLEARHVTLVQRFREALEECEHVV